MSFDKFQGKQTKVSFIIDFAMFANNYTAKRAHSAYNSLNSQTESFELLQVVLYLSSINIQSECR